MSFFFRYFSILRQKPLFFHQLFPLSLIIILAIKENALLQKIILVFKWAEYETCASKYESVMIACHLLEICQRWVGYEYESMNEKCVIAMNHCSFFCYTMHLIHEFRYRCYMFDYMIRINSLKIIHRQIPEDHCSDSESDSLPDAKKYQDHMNCELLKDHSLYQ